MRADALVAQNSISVRLVGLTDSAMNLEIAAMLQTAENAAFLEVRQSLLLGIVGVVDGAGSALAHPVSSIRLTDSAQAQLLEPSPAPAFSDAKAP